MKKEFYKFFVAIGFIVFAIGLLIDSFITESLSLEIVSSYSILAVFGFAFVFTGNATLNKFGYRFCALAGIYGLTSIMFVKSDAIVADIGAIVMFVGAIIRVIIAIPAFFGYKKVDDCAAAGPVDVYEQLLSYNKLLADQVIDAQEYEELKSKLFGERPSKASGNVDELKKWRKLAEQNIISEGEYSAIKAKILKIK